MRPLFIVTWALLAVVSCNGAATRQAARPVPAIPLLTFVFDDGNDTDYLVAREIFAEQGAVACSAVTTDWIDRPGHLSAAQIVALRDAGWEIMSHTATHPNLRSLEPAGVEEELSHSKASLEALGITVRNIVYPYNKSNDLVRSIARKYYRSGRGGTNNLNAAILDPYFLKSFSDKHDIDRMKGHIDRAYAERSWLIIYHHNIDARVSVSDKKGNFATNEELLFTPSGAVGRYSTSRWVPFRSTLYVVPLAGTPREGDLMTGVSSGAIARVDQMIYDERAQISEMIRYAHQRYPEMRIVTIDEGLDLYGVPQWTKAKYD